jgi:hypothetical protein
VCGGTGNNFGVLLEVAYRLHDLWNVWGFGFSCPIAKSPDVMVALQRDYMLDATQRQLGYQVAVITNKGEKRLVLRGTYHGSQDEGRRLVAPLLKLPSVTSEVDTVDTYARLNEGLIDEPYAYPDVPDAAVEDKLSGYVARALDKAEWAGIAGAYEKDSLGWAFSNFEVYGGAINSRPQTTNAFIHRDVYFDWVQDVFWITEEQRAVAEQFLQEMVGAYTPYLNGHANQDYPRRSQTNYRWLFFGDAFNTLLWVKKKYDPTDFFHYEQSISPYPPGEEPRDHSPSLFTDKEIVREPYSRTISG